MIGFNSQQVSGDTVYHNWPLRPPNLDLSQIRHLASEKPQIQQ